MKLVKVIFLGFLFLGCVAKQIQQEPIQAEVEKPTEVVPVEKEIAKVLKRQVKDVNLKAMSDDESLKKRIVILPFIDSSDQHPEAARLKARDVFMDELNKTHSIIALDSNQLKKDVLKYLKAGEYDLIKLAKDIQKDGVSSILEGKIIDIRLKQADSGDKKNGQAIFEAVVRIRILNIRTSKEIFNIVKTVTIQDDNSNISERFSSDQFYAKNPNLLAILIKDAFLDFSNQVIESMTQVAWEGRIAAFKGEKIFLNVGRMSGVQVGDILKVVEDGNEVYDPEIGYHIGKVNGQAKGTLEIIGFFGQDGSISVIHSGAGFKENDRVELYQ
ncbi:MAG: hypothetical protein WA160_03650 [Pseudobdellovibrio sp.]